MTTYLESLREPKTPPSPPTGHTGRYLVYAWSSDEAVNYFFSNHPGKARQDYKDIQELKPDLLVLIKISLGEVHFLKGEIDGETASAEEIQKFAVQDLDSLEFFHFEGYPPLSSYKEEKAKRWEWQEGAEERSAPWRENAPYRSNENE